MAKIQWSRTSYLELAAYLDYVTAERGDAAAQATRIAGAIQTLRSFPEAAPRFHGAVRRLVVTGLSLSIYYALEQDTVCILHVRHDKQKPQDLVKRGP